MKTILAKKLNKGDTIGVIAPSKSAKVIDTKVLQNSVKNVKKFLELNVSYGKNIFELNKLTQSSSIKSRLEDLHQVFKNTNLPIVMLVSGGFNANDLLPYVDWNLIVNNPKLLIGRSDATILSNAIYTKTGLITYSGPNFFVFGIQNQSSYTFDYFNKCIMSNEPFEVFPSKKWGQKEGEKYKNIGFQTIQKGTATGIIVGGNLNTLNLLQGSEYMPNLKGKVLLIEEDDYAKEYTPLEFERNLESLLQTCNRKEIAGILIGRFQKDAHMTFEKLKGIISRRNLPKTIPIISNLDFGHTMPMITFPIGGTIQIKAGKTVSINIIKH